MAADSHFAEQTSKLKDFSTVGPLEPLMRRFRSIITFQKSWTSFWQISQRKRMAIRILF